MDQNQISEAQSSSLNRLIFKNASFVTIGMIALKAINFLFNVLVVRRLGDERFGQYSVVLAFVGIFQIFAELGISQFVTREITRDHEKVHNYFWNLVVLRVLLALIGMAGIPLAAMEAQYSPELVLGIFIYATSFLLSAFSVPLASVLRAHERLDYVTLIDVSAQIVFIIFGSIFLFSGLGFLWLIVASLIGILPRIGIAIWAFYKIGLNRIPFNIDVRTWPHLVRAGIPFGIISLMMSIAYSIDTVILNQYVSKEEVGWYNVAYNLIFSLMMFSSSFQAAMVPSLSRVFVQDPLKVQRWYYSSVKVIFMISIPISVGGLFVAYPLIQFLYTREFLPAGLALQILIWDVPLLMFAGFCGDMTTITTEERSAARINTVNTLANIVLNLIFIPRFGMVGAALVTVTTDAVSALQFHFLLKRKLQLPSIVREFVKIIAASILMGGILYLVRGLNLFVQIGIGASTYFAMVWLFRVLSEQELNTLRQVFARIRLTVLPNKST
ncbi:MAG: flippase [Chloroflexi bacterium]|nr:flippase [Chloroflexota bacterium]